MQTRVPTNNINPAVAKLPPPISGRIINIPISLWPAYQRLHNLEVAGEKNGVILVHPSQEDPHKNKTC